MAFCTHCGYQLPVHANACPRCGMAAPGPLPVPPPTPPGWVPAPDAHGVLDHLLDDIRSFDVKWIVPVDTAISPKIIRNHSVWIMLFFGFFPLTILTLGLVQTQGQLYFAFTTYYCLAWAGWFFYFVCKKSVDFATGVAAMAFTSVIGVSVLLAVERLPGISTLYLLAERGRSLPAAMLGYLGGVGPLEELTKAVPVLILALGMNRIRKPMDGIFFGAMSGLGFAISEGVLYLMGSHGSIVQGLVRSTTLPFMHALWAATSGYYIALSQINKRRQTALIVLGIAVPAIHHGLYDAIMSHIPLWEQVDPATALFAKVVVLALAGFLYLLFVAYVERSQQMVKELQEAERLAAEMALRQQVWHQYATITSHENRGQSTE